MATNLNFTQDGSKYICEITPSEVATIQVELAEKKEFTVYGYIEGMKPVSLFSTNIYDNLIFQVDVPEGVTVRMVSWTPVITAKML